MNTRREFLKLGSVTLVAAGLFGPRSLFAASGELPLLGVGFGRSIPGPGEWVALDAATSLLGSDPAFLRNGARLAIRGSSRVSSHAGDPSGIEFAPLFPNLSGGSDAYRCFHAWSMKGSDLSGSISFTMPVAATNGLTFRIKRLAATGERRRIASAIPADDEQRVTLTLDSGSGIKLQAGVYIFAFREGTFDREPAWANYRIVNESGALTVPHLDLSYLVLEVDYRETAA
jgi:hypothetical protein